MKKVLVLISSLGDAMKRDAFEFCAGLRSDVQIAMLVPREDVDSYRTLGAEVEAWQPNGLIGMYRSPRALARTLARFAPDAIQAHDFGAATLAVATMPAEAVARTVVSFHDDLRPNELPERYVRERLGPMLRNAGARTAVAASLAAAVSKRLGIDPGAFTIVPHGVATATAGDLDRPAGRPGPVIGWFGRFGADRAWQAAVDVAVRVRQRYPAARLVAAGDGPSKSFVRSFGASTLGEAFELRDAASAREILPAIDVLLVPGGFDAQPHALLEALCWGVPVVAIETGVNVDVLSAFDGSWLTAKDTVALAEGVFAAWARIDQAWAQARAQRPIARERFSRETVDGALRGLLRGAAAVGDRQVVEQRPDGLSGGRNVG